MTGGAIDRVAVCGAGAMGGGIALLAALAGADVAVLDVNSQALDGGRKRAEAELRRMEAKGKLEAGADAVLARLSWIGEVGALGARDLVIEAVIEDLEIKRSLLAAVEQVVGDEAILASNTSSLPIAQLARGLARPDRFLGMHFFNPATAMKLVEVIAAPETRPELVTRVEETARAWGKKPVRVADEPGFIVNNVARPFYAEGFRAWQEGIDPALIDHLFRAGAGFRMGPLELSDLIGQDVNFAVARSVHAALFGTTRFAVQRAQAALVDGGRLGRKSGVGVFDYRSTAAPVAPPPPDAEPAATRTLGELALGDVVDDRPDLLVRVTRGRTAADESQEAGRPVAVLDWTAATGSAAGFAVSDAQAGLAAERIAALGIAPYRLPDRPGLLVARTLAQIANGAMDAILNRVADGAGIDTAMRFGANYPFGPVAWAEAQPAGAIAGTLSAIAAKTGQGMYLPSEQWSRR